MAAPCSGPLPARRTRDYVAGRLRASDEIAFEDHLAGCGACAAAVTELEAGLGRLEEDLAGDLARPAPRGLAWAWEAATRTVFAPVPALAYLAALLAAVVFLRPEPDSRLTGPTRAAEPPAVSGVAGVVSTTVRLFPEDAFRGSADLQAPEFAPEEVVLPDAEGFVVLDLWTGLAEEDLAAPGAAYRASLLLGDREVWSTVLPAGRLGERATFRLALNASMLERGAVYRLEVTQEEPGGRLPGQERFRRSFVVLDAGAR